MRLLWKWKTAISEAQLSVFAANAAFFLLLSLFPAMALLLGLIGRFALPQSEFFAIFEHLIPKVVLPLFLDAIYFIGSGTMPALSLSALAGLWSASRGIYSLLQGLQKICADGHRKGYIYLRLLAIVYTAAFLLALILTFVLYRLGRTLLEVLSATNAPIVSLLRFVLRCRGGLSFLFLSALFAMIYRTVPSGARTIARAIPGSLVTAGGWVLFSWLFSVWAEMFSSYPKVYGSVAVVALTMLWLYFCLEIVLFGALINEKLQEYKNAASD